MQVHKVFHRALSPTTGTELKKGTDRFRRRQGTLKGSSDDIGLGINVGCSIGRSIKNDSSTGTGRRRYNGYSIGIGIGWSSNTGCNDGTGRSSDSGHLSRPPDTGLPQTVRESRAHKVGDTKPTRHLEQFA